MKIHFSPQTKSCNSTTFSKKPILILKFQSPQQQNYCESIQSSFPSLQLFLNSEGLHVSKCLRLILSSISYVHHDICHINPSCLQLKGAVGHQGRTHWPLPSGPLGSLCPLHSSHVRAYRKYWVAFAPYLEGKSMHDKFKVLTGKEPATNENLTSPYKLKRKNNFSGKQKLKAFINNKSILK